ncbi:MAG: glycosyl transferase family 28 [Euzebyales bacterium]|nr:glycosyl transferase family 28 [Euzebyales bacterium]
MTLAPRIAFPPPRVRRRRRVALYSHDTQGLGHLRRNLMIAEALAGGDDAPAILLLSGAIQLRLFALPPAADCVTLPALRKDVDGTYAAESLHLSLEEVVALRSATIEAAVTAFAPDVLIVDKVARGSFSELEPTLAALAARDDARVVLGLRDVLDAPTAARREWAQDRTSEAVERYYDQVWVYGDRRVYDPVLAYGLPDAVARKVTFTGYLGGPGRLASHGNLPPPADAYVLCAVGGGQDGYALGAAFAEARMPHGVVGVLLCGPYMPDAARQDLERRAAATDRLRVMRFSADPGPLVANARAVVGMAGYNTAVELMCAGVPALLVPRVEPRLEQLVRAARLAELGLVDALHPDDASPAALTRWIAGAVTATRPRRADRPGKAVDLEGLARLPGLVASLTGAPGLFGVRGGLDRAC